MTHFQLPTIKGTIEQQLKQIVSYLTNQAEKLNYNVDNSTAEKIFEQAAQAMSAETDNVDSDYYDNRYVALKSLIIKTADEVKKTGDVKTLTLDSEYLAKSEFGEYFEKATVTIEGTAYGITQLYNYATDIKTDADNTKAGFEEYTTNTRNFINTGYLDTSESSPVFGIEVGLLADKFTVTENGNTTTIRNPKPHKIRITPGKISLFSNGYEVAWIEEKQIYFPKANITGGTIDIANSTFSVNNQGELTATKGNIGDWEIYNGGICYGRTDPGFGNDGYCLIAPKGTLYEHSIAGSTPTKNWVLAIGSAFGVTKFGGIFASSGRIGGFTIGDKGLYNGKNSAISTDAGVYVGTDGIKVGEANDTAFVKIYSDGSFVANSANITGTINASEGLIGDWEIYNGGICYGRTDPGFGNDGYCLIAPKGTLYEHSIAGSTPTKNWVLAIGSRFGVTKFGGIYASSGRIGGFTIGDNGLYNGKNSATSTDTGVYVGTDGIKVGEANDTAFVKIYSDGRFVANSATITGTITATSGSFTGSINASEGLIGDWEIYNGGICYGRTDPGFGNDGYCLINPNGTLSEHSFAGSTVATKNWILAIGSRFGVTSKGTLYATNVNLSGNITASSGRIGGFDITETYIKTNGSGYGNNGILFLCPEGTTGSASIAGSTADTSGWTIVSGSGFGVTKNGNLYANNARIEGIIFAKNGGKIGDWDIGGGAIRYAPDGIGFGQDGYCLIAPKGTTNEYALPGTEFKTSNWIIAIGSRFGVTSKGTLYATNVNISGSITATSGSFTGSINASEGLIGDWEIYNGGICYGRTTYGFGNDGYCLINPNGTLSEHSFAGSTVATKNWILAIGSRFGVTSKGTLYATNVNLSGNITATSGSFTGAIYASAGRIGGFDITETYIKTNGSGYGNNGILFLCPEGTTGSASIAGSTPDTSGWTIVSGSGFGVTKNGNLYANNARIEGVIIAKNGGVIGDWEIYNGGICYGRTTYGFGNDGYCLINPNGTLSEHSFAGSTVATSNWILAIGSRFGVTSKGTLYATNVNLSGNITATSGSFTGAIFASAGRIGGFDITETYIKTNGSGYGNNGILFLCPDGSTGSKSIAGSAEISGWTIASGSGFGVTKNGNLYANNARIEGTIIATSGSIGGFDINSSYIVTYGKTWGTSGSIMICAGGTSGKKNIGSSDLRDGWVITAGNNFGVDKDGYVFCKGAMMSEATFTNDTYFAGSILTGGNVYCSHDTTFMWASFDATNQVTNYSTWASVGTINSKNAFYIGVPSWTMRLNAKSVQLQDGIAVTSDARLKTDIQPIGEAYEEFFMKLSAKTYKYIEGTSDRTHFGFIAQELESAIIESGITTQDVAAYVSTESNRDGFGGYELSIRYSEIVALNTYMIQKCLNKIQALEDEIIILKNERNV